MKNTITLKEFFESQENMAIHCSTEEKANELLKKFKEFGHNRKYTCWKVYEGDTCYSSCGYANKQWYLDNGYIVYEYEDVIDMYSLKEGICNMKAKNLFKNMFDSIYLMRKDMKLIVNVDKRIVIVKTGDNVCHKVKCHEEDEFDWKIGFGLALSQAFGELPVWKATREFYRGEDDKLDYVKYSQWCITEFFCNNVIGFYELNKKVQDSNFNCVIDL